MSGTLLRWHAHDAYTHIATPARLSRDVGLKHIERGCDAHADF